MNLHDTYREILTRYLADHQETELMAAYELGKQFQQQQVSPDEIIGLHLETLAMLATSAPPGELTRRMLDSFSVLLEMMSAYGIAYSDAYRLIEHAAREAEDAKYELEKTIVELDLANQQLHDLDRVKTRFFSNMSHELRTPLNAIIGFAEDAADGLAGELTPRQARYVNNILNAGRHLLTVINDILDLAKLQSGKATMEARPVALADVLDELAATMAPLVKRKQQTLSIADTHALPTLMADRAKVYQILLNLVSNAHKFTPEGGHIRIEAAREGPCVRVRVIDDGIGIGPDSLAHLFEEFRQVEQYRKPHAPGTGLGLAITKQLVELHGGTIDVTSTPGVGSTFEFTLPLEGPAP